MYDYTIVHLGCAHNSDDIRIKQKECESLSRAGYNVIYINSYQSINGAGMALRIISI